MKTHIFYPHFLGMATALIIIVANISSSLSESLEEWTTFDEHVFTPVPSIESNVSKNVFNVRDFGAHGDGISLDTKAISRTFMACANAGGGEVQFPAGRYLTGPWEVACNNSVVTIDPDTTIISVNTTKNWPLGLDCPEPNSENKTSKQAASFVLANNLHNVTLQGGGIIDASGAMWWKEHCGNWWCPPGSNSSNPPAYRPFMFRIQSSSDIHIDNITFLNPGFWCIVPVHSERMTISNFRVIADQHSPNTDGIEPMWSSDIYVHDCYVSNGDDCMTVKSGSRNIRMDNCFCKNSHGITVGSIWYDDVTNVTYSNVVLNNTGQGPRIKGRRLGNATISDIRFHNITLNGVTSNAIQIDMTYGDSSKDPTLGVTAHNISYVNVFGTSKRYAGSLKCLPNKPCQDISMDSVRIDKFKEAWECKYIHVNASGVSPKMGSDCTN